MNETTKEQRQRLLDLAHNGGRIYGLEAEALNAIVAEVARLEAENARLREALERLIATVEMADPRTDSCMCGMAMEQHTMGDGHSPVDMGEYHAGEAVRSARAALRAATGEA
jgi:hypothetical protein